MISLKNKTNAIQPTSTYPYGKLKDDTGLNDGTPINQATNNDIHSFLQRLMVDGGLTPNEILDNEYDGFQLNTALINLIEKYAQILVDRNNAISQFTVWTDLTLINSWSTPDPNDKAQWRVNTVTGKVEFRGKVDGTSASNIKVFNAINSLIPTMSAAPGAAVRNLSIVNASAAGALAVIDKTGFLSLPTGSSYDITCITYYNR